MYCTITECMKNPVIGEYNCTLSQLRMKEFLPFLVTSDWEYVEIELSNKTPRGYLGALSTRFKIKPLLPKYEDIGLIHIKLLGELYPVDYPLLNEYYRIDKDKLVEYLIGMESKYEWKERVS